MLKIIPLGGLGEIGLNMMVMEYQDFIFIIDAGLMFPEDYMLGVDIVIPDMEYIRANREKVKGIILTHAHEDHVGALTYLLKQFHIPVFATPFTLGIVKNKLLEADILHQVVLHVVNPGQNIVLGPFEIEFIRVSHSTIDGVGLAIKTPVGVVVHTGDFRITHSADHMKSTDLSSFARFGEQGVLALLSDSTNVEEQGYSISEEEVVKNLSKIIANSAGRIIVALFASNVHRIQQVMDIAVSRNRKVAISGRSMEQIVAVAMELGYISCPKDLIVDVREIDSLPDTQVMVITTGSQGEPMSSLVRMASGLHKQISIKKGDNVILSSKRIPGNEKAIANIINRLYRRGATVIYSKIAQIHASGHAHQEELKLMINLTRPEYFIPIHGEYRHLVIHARLAEQLGIPMQKAIVAENGKIISFDGKTGAISGQVQTGRILVDGKGVGDVGRSVLKERRELSEGGLVVVTMIIDEETGVVLYGPELMSKGFVFDSSTGYLIDDAQCVILEIVEEIEAGSENRVDNIRKKLIRALKQYFSFTIGRRPMIVPIVLEI